MSISPGRGATRVATRQRIVERLQAAPEMAGTKTTYAFPGDNQDRKAVWFGAADGTQETTTMSRDGTNQEDTWTLKGVVWVQLPGGTEVEADIEAAAVLDALTRVLCDRRGERLGEGFQNVLIGLGNVSGPDPLMIDGTAHSVIEFDVELLAPID